VKSAKLILGTIIILTALFAAGCSHRLVANSGEATVTVYPDKEAFDRIKSLKNQGGPVGGMIGGLGENLVGKRIADQTTVKVLSSDDEGAQIEVLEGPNKGFKGYVPKGNVN
jgi:ABC-type oligopeptide transport system substrate-binding subunit